MNVPILTCIHLLTSASIIYHLQYRLPAERAGSANVLLYFTILGVHRSPSPTPK